MSDFGHNVKALRMARGLSLRSLAKRTGVSVSAISRVESAATEATTLANARKLAAFFGVTLSDLLAKPVGCMDCGMSYLDFPMDVVLPDDQWALVSGRDDGGGLMCAACIVKRGAATWVLILSLTTQHRSRQTFTLSPRWPGSPS